MPTLHDSHTPPRSWYPATHAHEPFTTCMRSAHPANTPFTSWPTTRSTATSDSSGELIFESFPTAASSVVALPKKRRALICTVVTSSSSARRCVFDSTDRSRLTGAGVLTSSVVVVSSTGAGVVVSSTGVVVSCADVVVSSTGVVVPSADVVVSSARVVVSSADVVVSSTGEGVVVSAARVVVSSADVVVSSTGEGVVVSAARVVVSSADVVVSCVEVVVSAARVVVSSTGDGVVVSAARVVVSAARVVVTSTVRSKVSMNVSTCIKRADVTRCSSRTNAAMTSSSSEVDMLPEPVNEPVKSKVSGYSATHAPLRRNWPFGQKHCELF